jgi:ankyrin repeat protein
MLSCHQGCLRLVQYLLENYDDIFDLNDDVNPFAETVLMASCRLGYTPISLYILLMHSAKINLNARNNEGQTLLMIACVYDDFEIVKHLLKTHNHMIDLNAVDDEGHTAFMLATLYGHHHIVDYLISKYGRYIDMTVRNNDNKTALELARENSLMNTNYRAIVRLVETATQPAPTVSHRLKK